MHMTLQDNPFLLLQTTPYCSRATSRARVTTHRTQVRTLMEITVAHCGLAVLALGAALAKEGVGAPELLPRFGLHGDALLADGVALLGDDVVAGVEPREGEVAVGAALELPRVDVDGLALAHSCGIAFSSSSPKLNEINRTT